MYALLHTIQLPYMLLKTSGVVVVVTVSYISSRVTNPLYNKSNNLKKKQPLGEKEGGGGGEGERRACTALHVSGI